ncbi:MAG: nuclease A inhibitor family protein [Minicystis sp.]
MKRRLSSSILALVVLGCAGADAEAATDSVTDTDGTAVFAVRADTGTCAPPACGGYHVSRVNRETTTCADGTRAAACYVAEIDLSDVGLTSAQERDLRQSITTSPTTVTALFRGKIRKADLGELGTFGRLVITAAFVSPAPVILDGTVYKMSTIGADCTLERCAAIREVEVNTPVGRLVSHLDLEGAPGDAAQKNDALVAAYSTASLLALGTEAVGSADRVFTATSFFAPVEAGEPLCGADFKDALGAATKGFTWMSEADYPIDPLVLPGEGAAAPTAEQMRALFHVPAEQRITVGSITELYRRGENQAGARPAEIADAMGYRALRHVLEQNLTDLRVFWFGETDWSYYIVGRTRCGELAGMHTLAVYT